MSQHSNLIGSSIDPLTIQWYKENGGFDAFYDEHKKFYHGTKKEFEDYWTKLVPKPKTKGE